MAFSSAARRVAAPIVVGCLLGAATTGGIALASASDAPANHPLQNCIDHQHANVEGTPTGAHYGNKGSIWVNSSGVIDGLRNSIYRSLFIFSNSSNWVETGWGAGPNNITGNSNPTVYAYWINRGSVGWVTLTQLYPSRYGSYRLENDAHVDTFKYFFDSGPSWATSPTMNFNSGTPLGNSERYNSCDSLWTDMPNLSYQKVDGSWSSDWGEWQCWVNTSSDYYLHNISDSELKVDQSSSGAIC